MKEIAYRIPDASDVSGIGRTTLYELIKKGEIESVHVGRRTLIIAASLHLYLDRLRGAQNQPVATSLDEGR